MIRRERYICGTLHMPLDKAVKELTPLTPKEAIELMVDQGVWPGAVIDEEDWYSPETRREEIEWWIKNGWVEKKEIDNLKEIFSRN